MKLAIVYYLSFIFTLPFSWAAAITSTRTTSTTIWATGTDSNGITRTTLSVFTQTFMDAYTTAEDPESGSIGLGTISGSVGKIRLYERTTISQNLGNSIKSGHNNVFGKNSNATGSIMAAVFLFFGVYIMAFI